MREAEKLVRNAREYRMADKIAGQALGDVMRKYGTGYPAYAGGERGGLAYHNLHHTQYVCHATEMIGEELSLSKEDQAIGRLAAAAHDIVHDKPRGQAEDESSQWLETAMQRYGFSKLAREVASLAILGTEPEVQEGVLVWQYASRLRYPCKSAETIALSVACADLSELYSPLGPLLGHDLYKESLGVAPSSDPPLDNLLAFQQRQVMLAETYRFPHPAGEHLFGRLRREVTVYHEQVLNRLERGSIDSWGQVVEQDRDFARTYSSGGTRG